MTKQPRLQDKYNKEVLPKLMAEFGYKTVMMAPRVTKIVLNVGTGRVAKDDKFVEKINTDLTKLTGQKTSSRKAKKSIASFKLREGTQVGLAVTLRGRRMYDFMDRLIAIALPRTKDFRGLDPKSFDKQGNLNIGVKEHNIFPEIHYETLKDIFGLQVTICTTAKTTEEGIALLGLLGFPLKKDKTK